MTSDNPTNPTGFDPRKYLIKLSRRARTPEGGWKTVELDYLETKSRILWLRIEHPEASITTELVSDDGTEAVFRATVAIPGAGSATGWGSEEKSDWKDYREKGETRALGRALAHLGYGTQFAADYNDPEDLVDAPSERQTPPSGAGPTQTADSPKPTPSRTPSTPAGGDSTKTPAPSSAGFTPMRPDQKRTLEALAATKKTTDPEAIAAATVGKKVSELSQAEADAVIAEMRRELIPTNGARA